MTGRSRLDAYLSALPGGLATYPACLAKGILVRMLVGDEAGPGDADGFPGPLRRLVEEPPMATEWVPEVHLAALRYALADQRGMDDDAVIARVRPRCHRLFEGAAYRYLMAAAGPGSLTRIAGARWATWHRGTTLEIEGIGDDGVLAGLRFPHGVFDGLHLRCFAEAFLAALDVSRARAPRADIVEAGAEYARYRVAWE